MYYTAITAIAASVYASLPSGIRSLLTEEASGAVYIRFLAFLACLCTFLLAFRLVGFEPVLQAIPFIAVLSCVGVVSFVVLGQRAFTFFDPVQFSQHIAQQLQENIARVVQGGHQWLEPAFQQYSRQRTNSIVKAAKAMGDLCKARPALNERPYVIFCVWLARILLQYKAQKGQIPSGSHWFVRRVQFGPFYQANETTVLLATRTGSLPEPTQIVDYDWLDEELESLLVDAFSFYLHQEDGGALGDIGELLLQIVDKTCSVGAIDGALKLIERLATAIELKLSDPLRETDREKRQRFVLIVAEIIGRLLIQAVLGVRKLCIGVNASKLGDRLLNLSRRNSHEFYTSGGQQSVNARLEKLNAQLRLEHEVEGDIKTPEWFVQEQIDNSFAELLSKNIELLFLQMPKISARFLTAFSNQEFGFSGPSFLRSETEILSKMDSHLDTMVESQQALCKNARIKGLIWKKIDADLLRISLQNLIIGNVLQSAASISKLLLIKRPTDLPDYPGLFLHQAGEALVSTLISDDASNFEKLFDAYFDGCLEMTTLSMRPQNIEPITSLQVQSALVPLAELLCLSGYSVFLDEAKRTSKISSIVTARWNTLLNSTSGAHWVTLLKTCWIVLDNLSSPGHRAQVRFDWGTQVARDFSRALKLRDDYSYGRNLHVNHPNPIVRVVAQGMSHDVFDYSGIEIFRAMYLFDVIDVPAAQEWSNLVDDASRNAAESAE